MYILLLQRTLIKFAYGCCTKPSMKIFPGNINEKRLRFYKKNIERKKKHLFDDAIPITGYFKQIYSTYINF